MEVILVKPIKKLGKIGNLVKVKNGFGRNWLIPQGLAIRATEKNKRLIESQKHDLEEKNTQAKDEASLLAKKIENKDLLFVRQSAADGRLFGSVNNKEIAKELSAIAACDIPFSAIDLEAPLKTIGAYNVDIHLHHDVTTTVAVIIARTESEAQDALRAHKSGKTTDEAKLDAEDNSQEEA